MWKVIFKSGSKLLMVAVLALPFMGCMKKRCYECKDHNNTVVAKGCDKESVEIESLAIERNWTCEILPD